MFRLGKAKDPGQHRYYLFPGQGRGARKKYRTHLLVALGVGLVFALLFAGILWLMNQRF
jgi:hypothetical protein